MKMSKFEKRFVNRRNKAEKNIMKVRDKLRQIESENIKNALEIGCGIGLVSSYLANEYGIDVYGTDFDPEEIQLAKQLNNERDTLHFKVEDATELSFANNSFDLVISQNVFHHIPYWQKAISEFQRVLRPDGYLIWMDLVFPALLKKMFKSITKNYGVYTLNDIHSEFYKAGFETVKKQKMVHGPFVHYEIVLTKI
ncbi:MAG: class I SAM-dependent methyltransferase [Candidatus Marinimicrobia bacterium]|nr:class I SAM-dependent methyltransferase [Candidatus Neomarinimicrobiota bacterium]